MAESSVSSLRHEFPALALAIAFIPRHSRSVYADMFLLWMEARRATYANEAMIAAVRLAWWRDAIVNQQSQSVPLAGPLAGAREITSRYAGIYHGSPGSDDITACWWRG
jgi:hypothetical protein